MWHSAKKVKCRESLEMLFSTFFMRQCLEKQFWRMYKMTVVSSVFTNKQMSSLSAPACSFTPHPPPLPPPPPCVLERIANWENVKNILT